MNIDDESDQAGIPQHIRLPDDWYNDPKGIEKALTTIQYWVPQGCLSTAVDIVGPKPSVPLIDKLVDEQINLKDDLNSK